VPDLFEERDREVSKEVATNPEKDPESISRGVCRFCKEPAVSMQEDARIPYTTFQCYKAGTRGSCWQSGGVRT